MKNILLAVLSLTFIACKSVSQIPQPNTYITNNYINKFQGTWKWVSGSDTVILRIGKVQYFYTSPSQSSADRLVGCHSYVRNGVLIESSLARYDSVVLYNHRRNTFYGWDADSDTSKAEGILDDLTKKKRCSVLLEYINGSTPQIIWKLENTKGLVAVPDGSAFDYNFTLPRNMILTKQ